MKFLIIAGAPGSLIRFRGHLISDLIDQGLTVHAASPDLPPDSEIRAMLEQKGVHVHEIYLKRTGMNLVDDVRTLVDLAQLMHRVRPDYVLGYTVKPVIFGTLAGALAGFCGLRRNRLVGKDSDPDLRFGSIACAGHTSSFDDPRGDPTRFQRLQAEITERHGVAP